MEFLYLDNKIAVCLKEPGLLSTDEPGGMPDRIRAALGTPDAPVYSVHRLDAAAGGVMVYARTRHAASDLGKAMAGGGFQKEYLAVVRGNLPEKSGCWRDFLRRDTREGKTYPVSGPETGGKEAVLDYEIAAERDGLSLVRVRLRTGRTHQIRCQFASRGAPLWGDRKYGPPGEEGPLALWSCRLSFPHPVTGAGMTFEKAPPRVRPWTVFEETIWKQE